MREQCVPGSLSSSTAQEPGNKASVLMDLWGALGGGKNVAYI